MVYLHSIKQIFIGKLLNLSHISRKTAVAPQILKYCNHKLLSIWSLILSFIFLFTCNVQIFSNLKSMQRDTFNIFNYACLVASHVEFTLINCRNGLLEFITLSRKRYSK